jgi:SOS response regulatory protein OraA/RecX
VRQRIQAAGISSAVADRIVDEVFSEIDAEALLLAALEKRLRGQPLPTDDRARQRLYRYLIGQGFDHDRVLAALRARREKA